MARQTPSAPGLNKPTILVVDDNADQWFIMRWAFLQRFTEVDPIWIAEPVQAIIYLENCLDNSLDLPQLILLDLFLPDSQTGLKTLQLFKQPGKLYADIPVLVLSQFGDKDCIKASYNNGAASYVVKPTSYIQ